MNTQFWVLHSRILFHRPSYSSRTFGLIVMTLCSMFPLHSCKRYLENFIQLVPEALIVDNRWYSTLNWDMWIESTWVMRSSRRNIFVAEMSACLVLFIGCWIEHSVQLEILCSGTGHAWYSSANNHLTKCILNKYTGVSVLSQTLT